jgi:hypothetical protein
MPFSALLPEDGFLNETQPIVALVPQVEFVNETQGAKGSQTPLRMLMGVGL